MEINYYCVEDLEEYKWREVAPLSSKERLEVLEGFGDYCFLDSDNLKFPICNKETGCISCKGLRAAYSRASQLYNRFKNTNPKRAEYYYKIKQEAELLAKFFDCEWVK